MPGRQNKPFEDEDDDAPPSSGRLPSAGPVASAVAQPVPDPLPLDAGEVAREVRRFMGSRKRGEGPHFVRSVVLKKLYGPDRSAVEEDLVAELVQSASLRALEAESLPWTTVFLRGWLKRLTHRAIADFFRAARPDADYLERGANAEELPDDGAGPGTDWAARSRLLCDHLERKLGDDPRDRETFRVMCAHEIEGHSLQDLARDHDTTPQALADRIYRLRKKLAPQVALMDREKPRRNALLCLILLGAVAVIALALTLYSWLQTPPLRTPVLLPPVQVHTAPPAPVFNQALPAPSSSAIPSAAPGPEDNLKAPPIGGKPPP